MNFVGGIREKYPLPGYTDYRTKADVRVVCAACGVKLGWAVYDPDAETFCDGCMQAFRGGRRDG